MNKELENELKDTLTEIQNGDGAKFEELYGVERAFIEQYADHILKLFSSHFISRTDVEEIVRTEMDKTEHMTNAEFIACDELAINIIKRLKIKKQ